MNRYSMPKEMIDYIKSQGYRVFMRDRADSYALFESAEGVGYIQFEPMAGYTLTTRHRANKASGTGYQVARHSPNITPELLRESVRTTTPRWSRRDPKPVKFANMDEYRALGAYEAAYREV